MKKTCKTCEYCDYCYEKFSKLENECEYWERRKKDKDAKKEE